MLMFSVRMVARKPVLTHSTTTSFPSRWEPGARHVRVGHAHMGFILAGCRDQTQVVDLLGMARILICESHEAVRQMLERMVARLGHEPVAVRVPGPEDLRSADVFVLEPAAPIGVTMAQAASVINPSLPLVCASVAEPPAELATLAVVFAASLVKPFTSEQLSQAIERALRTRQHPAGTCQGDCAA